MSLSTAKNSRFNIKSKILPQKKTKINNKIECIGLKTPITKVAAVKHPLIKKKKKYQKNFLQT